jgi:2'-5' RNA ligase
VTTLETILLIVPGYDVQAFAAPLRAKYARQASLCFPAHITILYPFLPPSEAEQQRQRIASILEGFPPFEVTLQGYRRFPTAWALEPLDASPMVAVQRQLNQAFPDYPPYGGQHGPDLVPHLTVAHFDDPMPEEDINLPPSPSFTFTVDRLHLYMGPTNENVPSIPIAIFPLRGQA